MLKDIAYINLPVNGIDDVVDLGVGRLDPFDPSLIKNYPVFKDPTKDFDPGTSLCKYGYPFHSITPTWDAQNEKFILPKGALPLPRFPIDGIFTRKVEIELVGGPKIPFPTRYIETSTPGLKGQSGGPIVDVQGTIWAIQAKTSHLKLGFDAIKPDQYLNVGWGVHPDTILGFFKTRGIKFHTSSY